MIRRLFTTLLERADTQEAIGLNGSRLRSTRPVVMGMRCPVELQYLVLAKGAENAYFAYMNATLSELHKHPAGVLRTVKAGHPVTLTEHGNPVAVISPVPGHTMSGSEFADVMRKNMTPEKVAALKELGDALAHARGDD